MVDGAYYSTEERHYKGFPHTLHKIVEPTENKDQTSITKKWNELTLAEDDGMAESALRANTFQRRGKSINAVGKARSPSTPPAAVEISQW
jgi:hypothetical protein